MGLKEIEEYILFIIVAVLVTCYTSAGSHYGKGSYFGGKPYDKPVGQGNSFQTRSPYSSYTEGPPFNDDFKQSQFGQNLGGKSYPKVSPVSQESYINDKYLSADKAPDVSLSAPPPTPGAQFPSPGYSQLGYNPRQPGPYETPSLGYPSPTYSNQIKYDPSTGYVLCDPALVQRWYSNNDNRESVYHGGISDHPTNWDPNVHNVNKESKPRFEYMSAKVTVKPKIGHDPQWGKEIPLEGNQRYKLSKVGAENRFGFWDSPTKMFINDFNQDGI